MNNLVHIGFIMDGNGRWAKLRNLPRMKGHAEGLNTVDKVIDWCKANSIAVLSLYVFSCENWSRPQSEVDALFDLARKYLKGKNKFVERNIKVVVSGRDANLPRDLVNSIDSITVKTAKCTGLTLNLCINYGGRQDIIDAANQCILKGHKLDDESFRKFLYNSDLPDVDLIVRTGGHMRLSNFMLFQAAYAELIFVDDLWPSVNEQLLDTLLEIYSKRTRNFGAI